MWGTSCPQREREETVDEDLRLVVVVRFVSLGNKLLK